MHLRKRVAALTVVALAATTVGVNYLTDSVEAALPAPVIVNNDIPQSVNAAWLETQNLTDEGNNRIVQATFLVTHDAARTITGVKADFNWDGTDNTLANAAIPVGSGTHVITATKVAGTNSSVVTARINVGAGPNFSGRAFNAPFRMRVIDSTNEQSASVTATIRFVEEGQSVGSADFPSLRNLTPAVGGSVAPGGGVSFQMQCDDPDINFLSSDDECDRAHQRWRSLDTGDTITLADFNGIGDGQLETVNTTAPTTSGHWVYEVWFGNENGSFPTDGQGAGSSWWRLGKVFVNAGGAVNGTITFNGGTVVASVPPSVNPNAVVTADAALAQSGGGIQMIEWNADHWAPSATFETSHWTIPVLSGGNVSTPDVSTVSGALTRTVDTAAAGIKTVQMRLTDFGSLDMADTNRQTATITSGQLRVNALPTANTFSVPATEDTPLGITLTGNDPDSQPNGLTYTQLTNVIPAAGSVSCTGTSCTYTPAPNFNGTAFFQYRVTDCGATVGACATSAAGQVNINVAAVNDNPTIDPKTLTTAEDIQGSVQLTGTDIEPGTLTYSLNPGGQATNGTAVCPASGLCTYTPNLNFFGSDSFIVRGTDSQGGFGTATVSVTVTPVNDAPTANAQTVTVGEDAINFPINVTGADVDDVVLSFTAPIDDVDNGTLTCLGAACTYSPNLNYNGPDSFTFKVNDGDADSNIATVTINVTPVNDDPVATDVLDAEADEDVPEAIAADGTDVDTGDVVTVDSATDPANGATQVTGANEVTYTGDLNFHGIDTYDFEVIDGNGGSDVGTVVVTVNPVNDAPVANDQSFTINEDEPTLLSIAAGDVDGDLISWAVVDADTPHGQVFGTGPDVVYVPDANYNGTDSFTVSVSDGNGGTDTALITITIDPVNDQPVADPASITTNEDEDGSVTLTGDDIDGDTLTFIAPDALPTHGTVTCTGADCTYTPTGNFNGTDSFTFTVDDGNGGSDTASVSITVTPVNDAPVAIGASAVTNEDTSVGIPLTASDVDGDALTFAYDAAGDGTVSGSGPNPVYTPNANFNGSDSFGYTVTDGNGGSSSNVVTIAVNAVNDAPVATGGSTSTAEDTNASFSLGATDVDSSSLTFTVTAQPAVGSVSCDSAGACTYNPPADFTGTVTVGYQVSDGIATGDGVFTIVVDPVNDLPVPVAGTAVTAEDTSVGINLTATDTEGDTLTYAVVTAPANGTVVCSPGGSCVYTPSSNANGSDSFTWSVQDGGPAVTSTVSITVIAVNDAPQALDVSASTNEDVPVSFNLLASDVEGDAITYSVDVPASHGSVSIAGNLATYTPAADYSGTDLFTFKATDSAGAFTTARASIVVNDVPLIGTALVGEAAVAKVTVNIFGNILNGGIVVFPQMKARLTTSAGAPLAGKPITFRIGGSVLCTATTNAQGFGECGGNLAGVLALLNLGYQVSFSGDGDYTASTARGPLLQILSLKI